MSENHIYYVSSPYHHLLALTIAENQSEEATAHLVSSSNFTNSKEFVKALREWDSSPIDRIHIFETPHTRSPPQVWLLQMRQVIKARQLAKSLSPTQVFVAKDMEAAPQSLLHYSSDATKIGIEDGTAAYSTGKFTPSKKWKSPIQRLFYGHWYKNPDVIGTSGFLDGFAGIFPELLRNELNGLHTEQIPNNFLLKMDTDWMQPFLNSCGLTHSDCEQLDVLLLAPHSSVAKKHPEYQEMLADQINSISSEGPVGVKYHPRDRDADYLDLDRTGVTIIPNSIPAEIIYLLSDNLTTVIGTLSTALMTARWLDDGITVISLSKTVGIGNERVEGVMKSIGIDVQ